MQGVVLCEKYKTTSDNRQYSGLKQAETARLKAEEAEKQQIMKIQQNKDFMNQITEGGVGKEKHKLAQGYVIQKLKKILVGQK